MKNEQIKSRFYIVLLIILMLVFVGLFGGIQTVYATNTTSETNVLDDLKADSTFKTSDFPTIKGDYSIRVIQIAEGKTGDLYLYTYQPSQATKYLIATDINMSFNETAEGTRLYGLTLLNSNGVFCKYRVNNVHVSSSQTRYYNITSIYRAWDKAIDKGTGNNNTIDKVAFQVGKIYKAVTENGDIKYICEPTYVVKIIDPYVDYLIYTKDSVNGHKLPPSIIAAANKYTAVDSHYIAFSTDWEIDRLLSADVSFYYCEGKGTYEKIFSFDFGKNVEYGASAPDTATVTYTDKRTVEGAGVFGTRNYYEWDCIQTVEDMMANERNLTEETKQNLEGKQWVLRFKETERTQKAISVLGYTRYESTFTKVDNVTVLRLEFETDGIVYNLGAVGNVQSGDEWGGNQIKPDDKKSILEKFIDWLEKLGDKVKGINWWQWILIAVGAIFVVGLIFSLIFFGVKVVLKVVFKVIWWLLTLPFRIISAIAKKIKNRGNSNE